MVVAGAGSNQDLQASGQAIGESALRASGLAGRLRLASGHRPLDPRRSPLLGVVKEVKLQRESTGRSTGPESAVTWELDEAGGQAVVVPNAVEAVMRELISNALDAVTDGGRITIRVRDESCAAIPAGMTLLPLPGRYSVLEVEDTGRGIAPDNLARVCEPFFTMCPVRSPGSSEWEAIRTTLRPGG